MELAESFGDGESLSAHRTFFVSSEDAEKIALNDVNYHSANSLFPLRGLDPRTQTITETLESVIDSYNYRKRSRWTRQ